MGATTAASDAFPRRTDGRTEVAQRENLCDEVLAVHHVSEAAFYHTDAALGWEQALHRQQVARFKVQRDGSTQLS